MKELKCPWCQKVIEPSQVKVKNNKTGGGTVAERRCPHCSKVLAAYSAEDKGFFPRLRTF